VLLKRYGAENIRNSLFQRGVGIQLKMHL